jgi:hypothetical protein
VLRHFVKAEAGGEVSAAPIAVSAVAPVSTIGLPQVSILPSIPVVHAPPDLLSLHSNFRI